MRRKTILLSILGVAAVLIAAGTTVSRPLRGDAQETVAALPSGWSTPVNISKQGGWSEAPTLAVDNNGRVHASWTEWFGGVGAPRAMMYNSTNANGQWPDSQGRYLVYPDIDDVGYPVVVCTPTSGAAMVTYHDANYAVAHMGIFARLFRNGVLDDEGYIPGAPMSSSYVTSAYNPVDGLFYFIYQYDAAETIVFEFAEFTFNPANYQWNAIGLVHGATGSSRYWPRLTFDAKGTAHLVYITRSPAILFYCKNATPSNPNTWTTPINISGDTARDWDSATIAADNDGDVYVAWYANTGGYESGTEEVMFAKTVNGVWQTKQNLTNNPYRSEGPSLAVNPVTKDIYLAYHESDQANPGNWEVMFMTYETQPNGQRAWSTPVNFTNSAGHDGEPSLRLDSKGSLHLAYHYTEASGNMEIYYTTKAGGVQPPKNVALSTLIDTNGTTKTNRLTWTNANAAADVTSNKIWRKVSTAADSTFEMIGAAGATATQADDSGLNPQTKYAYRITALGASGKESEASATVAEIPGRIDLPPAVVTVAGGVNKVLFYREKLNVITFETNPGNLASDVSGYEMYRKLTSEPDSALTRLATLTPTTHSYSDGRLPLTAYYSYAVKTKFTDGKLSAFSKVVADR